MHHVSIKKQIEYISKKDNKEDLLNVLLLDFLLTLMFIADLLKSTKNEEVNNYITKYTGDFIFNEEIEDMILSNGIEINDEARKTINLIEEVFQGIIDFKDEMINLEDFEKVLEKVGEYGK